MVSKFRRRIAVAVSLAVAAFTLTLAGSPADAAATSWRTGLLEWRAQHARNLAAPDGWLTLVGLDWLRPGDNSFGSAADNRILLNAPVAAHLGILELRGDQVQLLPPPGGFPPALNADGRPARATILTTPNGQSLPLTVGTLTLFVIHRGDRYALRVKDSQSPTRLSFQGLHWYPPDPRYRIEARWVPWTPPHQERIPTVVGTTLDLPAPGLAEFTLDGKTLALEPVLEAPGSHQLFFILRDTTSHTTTYGASRFLYTGFPDHGLNHPGHLLLDFNRLENPPCAYTPYATCPLPPLRNRLPVALPAGEERYSH